MTEEDPFVVHRGLLFTVAYEMLGSASDAEDVVQETWLRWNAIGDEGRAEVRDARAFLVRMLTRKALDRLRAEVRRREDYVGEWLPEPLLTAPDVADDVELAESVSFAMLTVLETLTPTERAVFVLREVFDLPYGEIADAVDKSAAAVRQIGHRAREHVAARRPRVAVSRREQEEVVERFLAAVTQGDLQGLLDVLAPDVVLVADGGGIAQAVRFPVAGAKKVANLLRGFPRFGGRALVEPVLLNGGAGSQDQRARRRSRHRDQRHRRGRADQPDLRRPQSREAPPAGRGGDARTLSGVADSGTRIQPVGRRYGREVR